VVIAVVVSLGLAALILTVGSPLAAAGVALAMLAFTALDIREGLCRPLGVHSQDSAPAGKTEQTKTRVAKRLGTTHPTPSCPGRAPGVG
jgi:hypothetical protein